METALVGSAKTRLRSLEVPKSKNIIVLPFLPIIFFFFCSAQDLTQSLTHALPLSKIPSFLPIKFKITTKIKLLQ